MQEYFGKRGMTVSVEVFLSKLYMTYHKQVYLVALDRCEQGTVDTLCIADKVIQQFSRDNPNITDLFLKSDNAGSVVFLNFHLSFPRHLFSVAFRKLPR